MLRHLCEEYLEDSHFYPKATYEKSQIDSFFEWYHNDMRPYLSGYISQKFSWPRTTGIPPNREKIQLFESYLNESFETLESLLKNNKENLLIFGDSLTIADMSTASEVFHYY